jgi:hypothetical protein
METLALLGTALGLATLAGINLYLTVFVTGLAIRFHWIELAAQYEPLSILGDPVVIGVAGTLFLLEFFADKIPWVDTLWDSVHTVIRPVGAAMLAITVLGDAHPVYDVIVGLLAGGMALTSHAAKAGTRLIANASPEPFSNIGLSLGEDALVLAGLGIVATNPLVALALSVLGVALAVWLMPKIFRSARTMLWFLWRRIAFLFGEREAADLKSRIPDELSSGLAKLHGGNPEIIWASPCVTGRGGAVRANSFGWLLLSGGPAGALDFATGRGAQLRIHAIETSGCKVTHQPGLVRDRLVIERIGESTRQVFQFDRSRRSLAIRLIDLLRARPEDSMLLASHREPAAAS